MDADTKRRMEDGHACLTAALEYLKMGWSVLPICPADHVGIGKTHIKTCHMPGKVPWVHWLEFQTRLPTEKEVRYWWHQHANSNVGMALGPVSGLIRIDVEGEAGEAALQSMSGGDLPQTLEFVSGRTVNPGRGLLYRIPEGAVLKTTHHEQGPKQEVRFQAKGAETVLPPSVHSSGNKYCWKPGHGPKDILPAMAPAWLVTRLAAPKNEIVTGPTRSRSDWQGILEGVPEGGRNDNAAALIGKMLGGVIDINDSSLVDLQFGMAKLWNNNNSPPMAEDELQKIFTSIQRREARNRELKNQQALDRHIANQIAKANESTPANPPEPSRNGHAPANGFVFTSPLPDWHLIVIQSDPVEYRLRAEYWLDSPKLKNGYLILTDDQIFFWGGGQRGIPRAAWKQAMVLVPPTIKNWAAPDGGGLAKLLETALHLSATPESQRKLYILGFLYRYLMNSRPVMCTEGKDNWSANGRPTIDESGSVLFKLSNLKKHVRDAKEDFTHREITGILAEYELSQAWPDKTRWWVVSKNTLENIGTETHEFAEINYSATLNENDDEARF